MSQSTPLSLQIIKKRTSLAYIATRVLDTPFWAIFNMLPFILYKDLHATPLQLAFLIALKPLVSIFSSYWSAQVKDRRDRLVSNIISARILSFLPFFFFPFFDNAWFFIASFGFYMMLTVGIVPAWMEILKINIPSHTREKVFAYTQAFGYMGGGLLPFALGFLLDEYTHSWRLIFPLAASLSLLSLFFQSRIIVSHDKPAQFENEKKSLKGKILHPWKESWKLIQQRTDFRKYQIGFMFLGSGLMIIQPALPIFFVDVLNLSYMELSIALTLCKGIGFAFTTPLWAKWMPRVDIFKFSSGIALLAVLFPIGLILAKLQLPWLYVAYFFYGIMQAGNELTWNLSGPAFAKEGDSSLFSSINIAAVGIRGCFVPALGSLLSAQIGSTFVMWVGMFLFFFAAINFIKTERFLLKPKGV